MSVLVEFSMTPLDKGDSVSSYVAKCVEIVADSGLPYKLGPMGTCLEGDWQPVMDVIRRCYEQMATGCGRISCSIKVDARAGHTHRLTAKVNKIETLLNRELDQ